MPWTAHRLVTSGVTLIQKVNHIGDSKCFRQIGATSPLVSYNLQMVVRPLNEASKFGQGHADNYSDTSRMCELAGLCHMPRVAVL